MAPDLGLIPWICWLSPTLGSLFPLLLKKRPAWQSGIPVLAATAISMAMAIAMLPALSFHGQIDQAFSWFQLPNGSGVGLGMLVDTLSIIVVNVVAFLCFLIIAYSMKYIEGDPSAPRYWFLMSLFVGGMLLLTLADNLVLFFVGWKIVGLCSYGLIGYHYGDEKEHWIGGPPPREYQKPSRAGLKALVVTTFGDIALLASVIILYLYSGTFNFVELYETAPLWLARMAESPGMLTAVAVLFLAGPLAKSAQFPFHEWLPEAMAGPTPVSALIHAATMVKAGVYLVARILPIFFVAKWVLTPGYPEALSFFIIVAASGGFTILLGGSQAVVAAELKKALAYSTISAIGYMMLALGVAGLSQETLVGGVSSSIFHLINHGIYKAMLFLSAGIAIHASGTIYLSEMGLARGKMRHIWAFMWIGALALTGVPPLSGFWSKEGMLHACLESGQYLLFAVASATVVITIFYSVRFIGLMFGPKSGGESQPDHGWKVPWLMLIPCAILASLTVLIGLVGPWFGASLTGAFGGYLESLGIPAVAAESAAAGSPFSVSDLALPAASLIMILAGAIPAYMIYMSRKMSAEAILGKHASLRFLHKFLVERWYIDAALNFAFQKATLMIREPLAKYFEGTMDSAVNVGIPRLLWSASRGVRRIQTGILSVNMIYFALFVSLMALLILLLGVP